MPERWIQFFGHTFPHPKTFLTGLGFSMASVLGVVTQENVVAIGMAVVALGTVLGGPTVKAITWLRTFLRTQGALDRKQITDEFATEVRLRLEADDKAEKLEREVAALKAQNAEQAEELIKLRRGLAKVGSTAIATGAKVEKQGQRIENLERATGSSDEIAS